MRKGGFISMSTKAERLVYYVLGETRADIRPFVLALDIIIDLRFVKHIPKADIRAGFVYSEVASRLGKTPTAVARSVERFTNVFWDAAKDQGLLPDLIGRSLYDTPAVFEILFYLAYLLYFGKPFFIDLDDLDCLDQIVPSA